MAEKDLVLVMTATGKKQHLSEDVQITLCGYQVAGNVFLSALNTGDFCLDCFKAIGGYIVNRVVMTITDERPGFTSEAAAPEPSAGQEEAAPQPQEPPGPQHEGRRPVRGRRRAEDS